jgi:integral membrane protein|tara:strand:- start:595 stop:789 length:195 start_codon:yes stop_codon:yes gene_type:complete
MKYIADDPSIVKAVGMPHGVLFIVYIFLAIVVRQKLKWNTLPFIIVLIASVIPFGTFYVDKKYL